MKKFWKVFGITICSIAGILLLAVLVAIYIVFTPKRLTPIVSNVVDQYVSCPHEVGEVDLTFFSTFPEFGVRINGLYLINPMEGAQSDTLLAAPEVVARVDIKKFLKENTLDVQELGLNNTIANIFINEKGESNIDVFVLPEDTTEDTTAFSLPFEVLNVKALALVAPVLSFVDRKDSIEAFLNNIALSASADGFEDININLDAGKVTAIIANEQYADDLHLQLRSEHTGVNLDSMRFTLRDASLAVDEFEAKVQGVVCIASSEPIAIDAHIETGEWDLPQLCKLLPRSVTDELKGIDIDAGSLQLTADVQGIYDDANMPVADAHLSLTDGKAAYMKVFPYRLSNISLDADAYFNLNKQERKESVVNIRKLHARTGKTIVDADGTITELLDNMLCDIRAKLDVNLPEFKRYLESEGKETDLQGRAKGTAKAKIRLNDLSDMRLAKGNISGNIDFVDLHIVYDSLLLDSKQTNLSFNIPNRKPQRKQSGWIDATLTSSVLNAELIGTMKADMGATTLHVQASDILSNSNMLYADLSMQTDNLTAELDSMGGTLKQPTLTLSTDYNMKAENTVPIVNAQLDADDIQGYYADTKAHLAKSNLTVALSPSSKNKAQPKLKASVKTESLKTTVGTDIKASTGNLSVTVDAVRNPKKENILLQWNPRLRVNLADGETEMKAFAEKINIPQLTFDYSNRVFTISKSDLVVGNSDFSLTGELRNIGKWLDKKDKLEGELTFTSAHTDVNELMTLVSADSGTEETAEAAAATADSGEANPFLVPKDVNVSLVTHIREAVVFDQLARNLGGKLYIQDGILILEEMGFICNAAKLQLTAMYKTPRRNHIYVGLDYHMTDINIQELIGMIPQIDTMLPMLRSFRGAAEFHLAAETYTNAKYELKPSTIRGACSIEGKNLVLLDSETFGKIAKILLFNRSTENKVDSVSAQITAYKDELNIYPFCITLDKYMAAVGGHHNLDMTFDYHVSLLKPLYIGVDVKGTFDDLKIKAAKCRYAQDFRPIFHKDVETQNASLKKMISAALKRNLKPQPAEENQQ